MGLHTVCVWPFKERSSFPVLSRQMLMFLSADPDAIRPLGSTTRLHTAPCRTTRERARASALSPGAA